MGQVEKDRAKLQMGSYDLDSIYIKQLDRISKEQIEEGVNSYVSIALNDSEGNICDIVWADILFFEKN